MAPIWFNPEVCYLWFFLDKTTCKQSLNMLDQLIVGVEAIWNIFTITHPSF
jgi:hypothetical protein